MSVRVLVIAAIAACLAWQLYVRTKASYLAVGFNNGAIAARFEAIEKLRALGALPVCPAAGARTELLAAKAESVFIVSIDGHLVTCQ